MKELPANLKIDQWYKFKIYGGLDDIITVTAQLKVIPTMIGASYIGCIEAKYRNMPFRNGQKLRVAVWNVKSIEPLQKDLLYGQN